MAIVVEDGTVVTGANSYASETELTAYATARGVTLSSAAAVLLIKAMDYLEQQPFIGEKYLETQALQWPRVNGFIDGFEIDYNEIPAQLKNAQMAIALESDAGYDPLAVIDRAVKREKVDVIEVEYADNAASRTMTPSITNALRKLIRGGGGVGVWRA